jgi:hypothetical protein
LLAVLTGTWGAPPVLAQPAPAGVVTAVHGTATIARAADRHTAALRFRDDVYFHDRVATGARSLARILLGGRAVVTAREHSILTITAVPGAATLDLQNGRLLLAVSKGAMRPGESIDIKTRNAIIGIRGTVVVAEFTPGNATDGRDDATVFTILRGLVEVIQVDPLAAHSTAAPLRLGALQRVRLIGARLVEVTSISAEQAKRLSQGFAVPIRPTPETSQEVARVHAAHVGQELTALLPPVGALPGERQQLSLSATDLNFLRTDGGSQTLLGRVTSGSTTGTLVDRTTDTLAAVTGLVPGVTGGLTGTLPGVTRTLTDTAGSLITPSGSTPPASPPAQQPLPSLLRTTGALLEGATGTLLK